MLGTWQATRPASSLTDSSPTASDSSTHNRLGSASARPTTAVRSYSVSRLRLPAERAGSSIATYTILHDLRNRASRRGDRRPPVCSGPMMPPEADSPPPTEPAATPPAATPASDSPEYLPFGAYAPPSVIAPRTAWTRTYELPSARQVVNAGLQLAQRANRAIG